MTTIAIIGITHTDLIEKVSHLFRQEGQPDPLFFETLEQAQFELPIYERITDIPVVFCREDVMREKLGIVGNFSFDEFFTPARVPVEPIVLQAKRQIEEYKIQSVPAEETLPFGYRKERNLPTRHSLTKQAVQKRRKKQKRARNDRKRN